MSKQELIEYLSKRMGEYTSFYEHPQDNIEHTPLENAYNEGVRRGLAIAIVNIRGKLNQNKEVE